MGVSLEDIKKLRTMTGAGLGDCKKALAESNGNIEEAIEIIRKKGQAVAAKRSDREAAEGAVLVKCENGFAAIIALKCETDFVAKNADFVKLAQDILDLAVANKCKSLEEVNALTLGGHTVAEAVTDRSGITGEKMELDGYNFIEGDNVAVYDHMGRHMLCTMVQTNKPAPQEVKDEELKVAIEKTKEEQVKKAVEAAIKKAGYNAYIAESEEHLEEGIRKGNITEEDAAAIRELKAKTAEEKSANLPEQMVQNIANGRMKKFYKESCLLNQEYIQDS